MKKFTAFNAFNYEFRNLYYDMTEAKGIYSSWDIYHIQEGTERPTKEEVMKHIFETCIVGIKHLTTYLVAVRDYRKNVSTTITN